MGKTSSGSIRNSADCPYLCSAGIYGRHMPVLYVKGPAVLQTSSRAPAPVIGISVKDSPVPVVFNDSVPGEYLKLEMNYYLPVPGAPKAETTEYLPVCTCGVL